LQAAIMNTATRPANKSVVFIRVAFS
jgi:hypothetical protein